MDFPYDKYIALSLKDTDKVGTPSTVFANGQTFAEVWMAQDSVIKAFDAGLAIPVVSCPVKQ
jgi:hypothetical protein